MKTKGLIALLDGLMAYTVAFLAVGMITFLMIGTHPSDVDTTYTLNVWTEDLADAIGANMIPLETPGYPDLHKGWRNTIDPAILQELNTSLSQISKKYGLIINIMTLESSYGLSEYTPLVMVGGDIKNARETAMTTRLLLPVDPANTSQFLFKGDSTSTLIVKVGKK